MLMLDCISWIPSVWYELQLLCSSFGASNGDNIADSSLVPHIPDDIIIDILSRLPAESVIQCRRVCNKWLSLTRSSLFAELHLKRGAINTPSIFMNWLHRVDTTKRMNPKWLDFRVYDNQIRGESVKKVNTKKIFDEMAKYEPMVVGSCDGLLLFISTFGRQRAFVLNPVTQELVVVRVPFSISLPCGIYCDPSTREYKVLLSNYDKKYASHSMVTLKTMQCESIMSADITTKMELHHHSGVAPNKSLFWIISLGCHGYLQTENYCKFKILVFCTQHENFHVHRHPGNVRSCCVPFDYLQLVETSEHLWLVNVVENRIRVWVLRDGDCYCKSDSCSWELKYFFNLRNLSKCNMREYSYDQNAIRAPIEHNDITIVAIRNDIEILFCWSSKVMFWYNVKDNSVRRAWVFKKNASRDHSHIHLRYCAYAKTFVSVNGAKSE